MPVPGRPPRCRCRAAPPPPRALADFARAVQLVKSGKDDEAELEFQQIATGYPTYPGALVNLGILYRKHGELAKSDQSLHAAVQRDANDAEGWSELGVTLRQEGKFHEAADAYNHAISANPNFAPAYRNLAIVLDLYLGDTAAALAAMQHYQELAADDKAVTGWIADLKQRAGKSAAARRGSPVRPRHRRATRRETDHATCVHFELYVVLMACAAAGIRPGASAGPGAG